MGHPETPNVPARVAAVTTAVPGQTSASPADIASGGVDGSRADHFQRPTASLIVSDPDFQAVSLILLQLQAPSSWPWHNK